MQWQQFKASAIDVKGMMRLFFSRSMPLAGIETDEKSVLLRCHLV